MNKWKKLLTQVLKSVPKYEFDKLLDNYEGNYMAQEFSCWKRYILYVIRKINSS